MKNKIKINPILKKDIMTGSRNMRMMAILTVINFILICAVLLVMSIAENMYSNVDYYKSISAIYPVVAVCELIIIVLVIPIMTAGSISGERERQTLDIMLTTPIKPFSIVLGKLLSALMTVMMYIFTSIPFIAVAFMFGGMELKSLLGYVAMIILMGIYVGSIGVYSSSKKRTSVAATVHSIILLALIMIVTLVVFFVATFMYGYTPSTAFSNIVILNIVCCIIVLNPWAACYDFLMKSTGNISVYEIMSELFFKDDFAFLLTVMKWLIPISIVVNLLISYFFLRRAAAKTVVNKVKKKKKLEHING